MILKITMRLAGAAVLVALATAGCSRSTGVLRPWPNIIDPVVFQDGFTAKVSFQAFGNSKLDALNVDTSDSRTGTASVKVGVPSSGGYAGGAFVASQARDFSPYNALTFWARASRPVALDVAGLGNDNTGTSRYEAQVKNLALTTTWKHYVIPIPDPAKLTAERGLFFFAASPKSGAGYDLWMDDVTFDSVATIGNPRPSISTQTLSSVVGSTISVLGARVTYAVDGLDQVVEHSPAYFTYESTDTTVAKVTDGTIRVVGSGRTTITARLDTLRAVGSITIAATAPPNVAAPTPTVPAGDVIALFCNAYTNVPVDTWSASWDQADVSDIRIAGDDVKLVTNLLFAGVEFTSNTLDVSQMTHLHMDVWIPDGTTFKIKLVDFGANNAFGGGDDREHEVTLNANSVPRLQTRTWAALDIALENFTGLTTRAHLAQLIISGDTRTVYVDNVYFRK